MYIRRIHSSNSHARCPCPESHRSIGKCRNTGIRPIRGQTGHGHRRNLPRHRLHCRCHLRSRIWYKRHFAWYDLLHWHPAAYHNHSCGTTSGWRVRFRSTAHNQAYRNTCHHIWGNIHWRGLSCRIHPQMRRHDCPPDACPGLIISVDVILFVNVVIYIYPPYRTMEIVKTTFAACTFSAFCASPEIFA